MKIIVENLDSNKVDEIKTAVSSLATSRDKVKELPIVLNNTKGDYKLALDLAKFVHASKVDLLVNASGTNDAAGTILAVAGKKGTRHASFDAIFVPFDAESSTKRGERLSPQNQSILSALKSFEAHGRGLKSIFSYSQKLSAFEAKSLRIVDKVDRIESKYKDDSSKKSKSGKKSSKRK